jgi:hypothetical protein
MDVGPVFSSFNEEKDLSKVILFQITAMTDNDVQRASKLSIGPANTWSKDENRLQKENE